MAANGHAEPGVQVHDPPVSTAGQDADKVKVVIAGAGPAGLLLAHYLLTHGKGRFSIRMFDKGDDPRVTLHKGLDNRRWSITLHKRAECCFSLIPELAEKIRESSVQLDGALVYSAGTGAPKEFKRRKGDFVGWMQDRVSICAIILQSLIDAHVGKGAQGVPEGADIRGPDLSIRFNCACTGIDLQKKTVTFAPQRADGTATLETESYDVLVGADGLRSVVRSAFQSQMRTFEYEQKSLFSHWTITHFPPPPSFRWNFIHLIPPLQDSGGVTCVVMPSVQGKVIFIAGWNDNDDASGWLSTSTPKEAHQFLASRVPQLEIPEDAAWQLRSGPLQTSMQIKCWKYHDSTGHAVLVGDAAHATCPSLGLGCNSSLVDASVLGRLLCGETVGEENRVLVGEGRDEERRKYWGAGASASSVKAKIPELLQMFSALQVKEGHAVVDLSDAHAPVTPFGKVLDMAVLLLYSFLSLILPFLFPQPLQGIVANSTKSFTQAKEAFWWESWLLLWSKECARRKHQRAAAQRVLAKSMKG